PLARRRTACVTPFPPRRVRGTTTAGSPCTASAGGAYDPLGTEPDRLGLRAVATGAPRRARFRGQRRCGEPHHRAAVAALGGGPGIRHPLLHQLPGWFGDRRFRDLRHDAVDRTRRVDLLDGTGGLDGTVPALLRCS